MANKSGLWKIKLPFANVWFIKTFSLQRGYKIFVNDQIFS